MTAKEILYGNKARKQIGIGLDTVANAVKVTLGARGRSVLIAQAWGSPTITKDGATVAKEIELDGHFVNMGAQMVKEAAAKTAEITGDGTTTATVLAQAIYTEGVKLVTAGVNPIEIKRGIDSAVALVVKELRTQSKATTSREETAQIAAISANGDTRIGELIADAMEKVGKQGVITVEEAQSTETTLSIVEGMQFERGYLSPYFVSEPDRMEVVLTDAYVLLFEKRLSILRDLVPLLEQVAKADRSLLIVAEDVDAEALAALIVNKLKGTLRVCAVKAPSFGNRRKDTLEDIAILLGCRAITEELGTKLSEVELKDLGQVKKVIVTRDTTTLIEGSGTQDAIQARSKQLSRQLEEATSEFDQEKLKERLAKLSGGVAILKVGAATETEMKATKARVQDALHATRAAVEEGIVAGGGVALMRAIPALDALRLSDEQQAGVGIIRRAIEAPLRQIAENGGADAAVVAARVREGTGAFGYNVASGAYEDLIVAGVIDPAKVVRVALQNAASVAALMLTTEAMIVQHPSSAQASSEMHGGM